MNDKDFRDRLRKLPVPIASGAARERARHRAMIAYQNRGEFSPKSPLPWMIFSWAGAFTVIVLAFVLGFLFFRNSTDYLAKDREILRQTDALFAGQLNAVIERDGEIQIQLADESSQPSDQPILIQFRQNGHNLRVLSYSGRSIDIILNGKHISFEALATSNGGIILTGENFLWSQQHPDALAGYRVEARSLVSSL